MKTASSSRFDRSVFINCPLDAEYYPLLTALLFTLRYLGFSPRLSPESLDSSESRLDKIKALIGSSRLGIHDLSRLRSSSVGELSRMNMPFELGLDIGCKSFGKGRLTEKRCLVLEEQPFRYHAALSDLSGSDIMSHSGSPERIVYCVRKWVVQLGFKKTPQAKSIWYEYQRFLAYVMLALQAKGMTEGEAKSELSEIPISEFLEFVDDWQSD